MRQDIKYWIGLSKIYRLGASRFEKVYSYFDSMETAWVAGAEEWRRTGLDDKTIDDVLYYRGDINPDEEIEKIEKEGVKAVTVMDENYPEILKQILNPPAVLYYKGTLEYEGDKMSVGIVGTRKFSEYGKQVTEDIVADLARQGITIVSGLALGVDALAHQACLKENGRTIAVIGSGLDRQNIYPSLNRYLSDKIVATGGLMLSEYPIGTMPMKQNFPQRNRIISGLSLGTLVVEAPESSGALITAKFAVEQNRDVFAVPGNIYAQNSAGSHNLIKLGAKLVAGADDILEALNLGQAVGKIDKKEIKAESTEEEALLKVLSHEPMHINELIKESGLDAATANSTMVLMEMRGKVKNLGGMRYITSR